MSEIAGSGRLHTKTCSTLPF